MEAAGGTGAARGAAACGCGVDLRLVEPARLYSKWLYGLGHLGAHLFVHRRLDVACGRGAASERVQHRNKAPAGFSLLRRCSRAVRLAAGAPSHVHSRRRPLGVHGSLEREGDVQQRSSRGGASATSNVNLAAVSTAGRLPHSSSGCSQARVCGDSTNEALAGAPWGLRCHPGAPATRAAAAVPRQAATGGATAVQRAGCRPGLPRKPPGAGCRPWARRRGLVLTPWPGHLTDRSLLRNARASAGPRLRSVRQFLVRVRLAEVHYATCGAERRAGPLSLGAPVGSPT